MPRHRGRRTRGALTGAVLLSTIIALVLATPASADPSVAKTTRVSSTPGGSPGNGPSTLPAMSADGRYITYQSAASNLVSGDTNGTDDIFRTDITTGTTIRINTATGGAQSNAQAFNPAISADGRYITYNSTASNLVPGDTNGSSDVFLRDTTTGTTTRISTATGGAQSNADSGSAAISADGRYVTYQSAASNLLRADTNATEDIYLTDTRTGTTTRISVATDGTQAGFPSLNPAISADGRYIAYQSIAGHLAIGDNNSLSDIFVTDTLTATTTRISVATDGTQGNDDSYDPAISADGRYVTYRSAARNLVTGDTNDSYDVFLTDTVAGTTTRISTATDGTQGDDNSYDSAISADGRLITYNSYASNLVTGDTNDRADIYLTDTRTGTTTRISTATDGTQGNDSSARPAISADGRSIIYNSYASNLASGDTNTTTDIFLTRVGMVPSVSDQPADTTVPAAETAHFSATFTDAASIQWQAARDPGGPWSDIPGATGNTLDLPTNAPGISYVRAIATNSDGSVTTDTARLTATPSASDGEPTTAGDPPANGDPPTTVSAADSDPTRALTIAAAALVGALLLVVAALLLHLRRRRRPAE